MSYLVRLLRTNLLKLGTWISAIFIASFVFVLLVKEKSQFKASARSGVKDEGLKVMSSAAFSILQTVRDHQEFNKKVSEIRRKNPKLGHYLKKSQRLSEKFYQLTLMSDKEAVSLPVKAVKTVNKTSKVIIYNRISKTGSSTLLSK